MKVFDLFLEKKKREKYTFRRNFGRKDREDLEIDLSRNIVLGNFGIVVSR